MSFQDVGDYKDARDWAQYSRAMESYEAKEYGSAASEFESLGEFEDSKNMKDQSNFMASISDWLDKDCAGSFYFAPYNEKKPNGYWRSLDCTITLNTDGSCKIVIPQNGNEYEIEHGNGNLSQYLGEWEGTWSPSDKELVISSFPSETNWGVSLTTYSQTSTKSSPIKKDGPIIRSKSTGQEFFFKVFN